MIKLASNFLDNEETFFHVAFLPVCFGDVAE